MCFSIKLSLLLGLGFILCFSASAQEITIKGKITDATTGDPVTYATIAIKGASIGTNSNFDGLFRLRLHRRADSLTVSCIDYRSQSFLMGEAAEQEFNVRLVQSSNALKEVRISPKGYVNPAWEIMKQVILHKDENDPRKLSSYQYESYNRVELDASSLSKKLIKKKSVDKALSLADSLKITDADHMPVLPVFLSETVSDYYYQSKPETRREDIKRTKTNGIGFEDGTLLAQLTGSTFQQYNFYKNIVSAAGKEFASPLTDSWKNWYDYKLDNRDAIIVLRIMLAIRALMKLNSSVPVSLKGTVFRPPGL